MRPLAALFAALLLTAFSADAADAAERRDTAPQHRGNTMNLGINGRQFPVDLADNAAARAFAALLPLTLEMSDLHGNEKYRRLGARLPSRPENPGRVRAGDLMLFGDDCVVLFYKDFDTGYSYTRIGRLKDAAGLAAAAGRGAVTAEFSLGASE